MSDDYDALLDRLSEALKGSKKDCEFSDDDVKVIRNMMKSYHMLLSWGKLGRLLIWGLITLAAGLTALTKIRGWTW